MVITHSHTHSHIYVQHTCASAMPMTPPDYKYNCTTSERSLAALFGAMLTLGVVIIGGLLARVVRSRSGGWRRVPQSSHRQSQENVDVAHAEADGDAAETVERARLVSTSPPVAPLSTPSLRRWSVSGPPLSSPSRTPERVRHESAAVHFLPTATRGADETVVSAALMWEAERRRLQSIIDEREAALAEAADSLYALRNTQADLLQQRQQLLEEVDALHCQKTVETEHLRQLHHRKAALTEEVVALETSHNALQITLEALMEELDDAAAGVEEAEAAMLTQVSRARQLLTVSMMEASQQEEALLERVTSQVENLMRHRGHSVNGQRGSIAWSAMGSNVSLRTRSVATTPDPKGPRASPRK